LQRSPYVWAQEYESAVLELDREKLIVKIAKAETALQQRRAELLQQTPISADELEAIERASRALSALNEIAQRDK